MAFRAERTSEMSWWWAVRTARSSALPSPRMASVRAASSACTSPARLLLAAIASVDEEKPFIVDRQQLDRKANGKWTVTRNDGLDVVDPVGRLVHRKPLGQADLGRTELPAGGALLDQLDVLQLRQQSKVGGVQFQRLLPKQQQKMIQCIDRIATRI